MDNQWCVLVKNDPIVSVGQSVAGPFDSAGKAEGWIAEDLDINNDVRDNYLILPFFDTRDD